MITGKDRLKLTKWAMICTPRTASTSLSMMLNLRPQSEMPLKVEVDPGSYFGHLPAIHIARNFGFDNWRKVFSFGFVRNPWSRAVSICLRINPKMLKDVKLFEEWLELGMRNYLGASHLVAGDACINWSCSSFVLPCTYVGRYETLKDDVRRIFRVLGRPEPEEWLHKEGPLSSKPYQDFYTDNSRRFIAERYHDDISNFGYEFNE